MINLLWFLGRRTWQDACSYFHLVDFNNKNVFVSSVAQNRLRVTLNNQQKDKGSEKGQATWSGGSRRGCQICWTLWIGSATCWLLDTRYPATNVFGAIQPDPVRYPTRRFGNALARVPICNAFNVVEWAVWEKGYLQIKRKLTCFQRPSFKVREFPNRICNAFNVFEWAIWKKGYLQIKR